MFFTASSQASNNNYKTTLQIINQNSGKANNFLVRIARTHSQQEKGLMFVNNLPQNYGMIFEFSGEQMVYMWMKNTQIPLDILFIDKNNKVVTIKENAKIESLEVISSIKPVIKVLEINGGLVEKLGIGVGNQVIY